MVGSVGLREKGLFCTRKDDGRMLKMKVGGGGFLRKENREGVKTSAAFL